MGWDAEKAKKRVDENDFRDFEVNVADLAREMDFANLGTKDVRRADAAHIYMDVPNMHLAVRDAGDDNQKQRKLLRAASVLRRVEADILRARDIVGDYDIGRIQQQAARLHALCFKPYGDEAKRAKLAVVAAISINSYIYEVFNSVFEDVRNFQSAVGISAGRSLIANIGFHGERERISLGTPANLAAKVLGGGNSITVTAEVFELLPSSLRGHFEKDAKVAGVQTYRARGLTWGKEPDLAEKLGVSWDADTWRKRTEEYRDDLPLDEMEVAEARELIDLETLTERNSRRTEAIAIFADLDGFTKYVQDAEKDDAVVSLVRHLHMMRREFHAVLKNDYPGLVLQHQGDRVFAILHVPCGEHAADETKRCEDAVHAAVGLQSSMEDVLRDKLGADNDVHVAVGLAVGRVLVTRLGKKGKREVICLGPPVDAAEDLQLASAGREIRISKEIYDRLKDGPLKDQFSKSGDAYVASGLTFRKLDELEDEADARAGRLGAVVEGDRVKVTSTVPQTRPWSAQ